MSLRPRVRTATSSAALYASRCSRTVLAGSTARHWGKKSDFSGSCDPRIAVHMALIDRAANHLRIFECIGIALALARKPCHQIAHGRHAIGRIDIFFGLADALTHPSEVTNLHTSSFVRWCSPACK